MKKRIWCQCSVRLMSGTYGDDSPGYHCSRQVIERQGKKGSGGQGLSNV